MAVYIEIKVKFHMELLWDAGMNFCSSGPGHMTKMAAMPIYGTILKKIFFSGTKRPMILNLGMHHWVLEYYQVCSNDDPELLTYLWQGQIWSHMLLYGKKVKQWIFQKLNMSALKCYFASFNIFFFKRDITLNVGKWYQILWDNLHIV